MGWSPPPILNPHLLDALGFFEGPVRIAYAAGDVGREWGGPNLQSQSPGRQLDLSLAVNELVEAHKHLHAQVPRHIVAGGAAEFLDPWAGRRDLIAVSHAHRRLYVGPYLHGARSDSPLPFQPGNDPVQLLDLPPVLCLGVVDLGQAGPDYSLQVGLNQVVVDAGESLGTALGHVVDGVLDEASGVALQVLGHRVFQVQVDVVAAPGPSGVDKPGSDHRHGQARAPYLLSSAIWSLLFLLFV